MNTFIDNKIQSLFDEKANVTPPQILNGIDIAELGQLVSNYKTEVTGAFHSSRFVPNVNYKKRVDTTIVDEVSKKKVPLLNQQVLVFGNFMIKKPSADNFLQTYSDWAYIDESKNKAISVWLAQIDTNKKNGCLVVIENFRHFAKAIRGLGISQNRFIRDKIRVKKDGKLLPVKASDAIVYDYGLLHCSLPNISRQIRVALNFSLVPKDVQAIHSCSITERCRRYQKTHCFQSGFLYTHAMGSHSTADRTLELF